MLIRSDWYREKYPPTLVEAITVYNFFETLGFDLEAHVTLALLRDSVIVCLKVEDKEAQLFVGTPGLEAGQMLQIWSELLRDCGPRGSISEEERDALLEESLAKKFCQEIVFELRARGFTLSPRDLHEGHTLH